MLKQRPSSPTFKSGVDRQYESHQGLEEVTLEVCRKQKAKCREAVTRIYNLLPS
jgi:hypothetical protein